MSTGIASRQFCAESLSGVKEMAMRMTGFCGGHFRFESVSCTSAAMYSLQDERLAVAEVECLLVDSSLYLGVT